MTSESTKLHELLHLYTPTSRILTHPSLRLKDLKSLSLVSKAFNEAVSPFLYARVYVSSGWAARRALESLLVEGTRGAGAGTKARFVQSLIMMATRDFHPREIGNTPELLKRALPLMSNLTFLYIAEQWEMPAQVFSIPSTSTTPTPTPFPFQLRDLRLYGIHLDADLIEFLGSQEGSLRSLTFWDPPPTEETFVLPGTTGGIFTNGARKLFPFLIQYEGTILLASELLSVGAPFINLSASIEPKEDALEIVRYILPLIGGVGKTIRSLKLVGVPSVEWASGAGGGGVGGPEFRDLSGEIMRYLSRACRELRYIGVLPISWKDRSMIHKSLIEMHHLQTLEVFIDGWQPLPNVFSLKAVAAEFRVYCPSLRVILFDFRMNQRVVWSYDAGEGQWRMSEGSGGRYNWDDAWIEGAV